MRDNRLDEDLHATYHIRFANGVEAWSVPAGPRDFEIIGTEGSVRSMGQGTGAYFRKAPTREPGEASLMEILVPEAPARTNTVAGLEDLVDAHESGRKTRQDVSVITNLTEACLAVAESHRIGGGWVDLPMQNRDLYVFHV